MLLEERLRLLVRSLLCVRLWVGVTISDSDSESSDDAVNDIDCDADKVSVVVRDLDSVFDKVRCSVGVLLEECSEVALLDSDGTSDGVRELLCDDVSDRSSELVIELDNADVGDVVNE